MQHRRRTLTPRRVSLIAASLSCIALLGARSFDSPFVAECTDAMLTMMRAMHVQSHGDADADFAAMMIPHHEGAIAMAKAELRYGKNEQLRRLAQEMIITQQSEIVAMRMATVGDSSQAAHAGVAR